jgi:hypothetical protein
MGLELPPVDTLRTRRQQSANTFLLLFDGLLRDISRFVTNFRADSLACRTPSLSLPVNAAAAYSMRPFNSQHESMRGFL